MDGGRFLRDSVRRLEHQRAFLPLATGLTFTNGNGGYVDTNAGRAARFYRVVSP
jgi:hypothetical protein